MINNTFEELKTAATIAVAIDTYNRQQRDEYFKYIMLELKDSQGDTFDLETPKGIEPLELLDLLTDTVNEKRVKQNLPVIPYYSDFTLALLSKEE